MRSSLAAAQGKALAAAQAKARIEELQQEATDSDSDEPSEKGGQRREARKAIVVAPSEEEAQEWGRPCEGEVAAHAAAVAAEKKIVLSQGQVHGAWYVVHGTWCMVHGAWFMYHHVLIPRPIHIPMSHSIPCYPLSLTYHREPHSSIRCEPRRQRRP